MKETDLEIYDVYETVNGNLFIKICENYSIAIGPKGKHEPDEAWGELERSQYVKITDTGTVKKVGKIVFE